MIFNLCVVVVNRIVVITVYWAYQSHRGKKMGHPRLKGGRLIGFKINFIIPIVCCCCCCYIHFNLVLLLSVESSFSLSLSLSPLFYFFKPHFLLLSRLRLQIPFFSSSISHRAPIQYKQELNQQLVLEDKPTIRCFSMNY